MSRQTDRTGRSGAPDLLVRAGLDEAARASRLAFLDLGSDDEERLRSLRDFACANVEAIVDEFYDHLMAFEYPRRLLNDGAAVARLKSLQRGYFLRMFEGGFDQQYFESRLRVGAAHAAIGLHPEWYLGTYHLYVRLMAGRLQQLCPNDPDRWRALLESFAKVVFLDLGLAIDAYILSGYVDRSLAQEYRRVADVAERTLAEKAELEQAKADLTGMIVHDLKGPLGGILAVTQLALRDRSDDPRRRHFEQIQRSARDLMRMIENLLEIDQLESGRLELRLEPVNVDVLLADCAEEYRAAGDMAGLRIGVTAAEGLPILVVDRWLLRRVLNNLVVNAIRHSAAGRVDLEAALDGDQMRIRVRDTGRGMTAEEQVRLFEKSRRAPGSHRDDTGLGLVFCKMAIERMDGTIEVETAPQAGATFTVRLPLETRA